MRSSRASSRCACSSDFGRHPRIGDRLLQVRGLRSVPAASPSSFWIWCSRSRNTASFCRSSKASRVRLVDLARHLQHLDAPAEQRQHPIQPRLQIEGRENFLFLGGLQVHEAGDRCRPGSAMDSMARIGVDRIRRAPAAAAAPLRSPVSRKIDAACLDLADRRWWFLCAARCGRPGTAQAHVIEHGKALLALGYQMMRAVRGGDEADDRGGGADPVQQFGGVTSLDVAALALLHDCSRPTRRWVRTASCAAAREPCRHGNRQHDARETARSRARAE